MNKRIFVSLLIASLIPILFWFGGYNFDTRDSRAVLTILCTLATFIFSYTCPAWHKDSK